MITLTEHKDPCKTVNLDVDGYVIPNVRRGVAEYIAGLEAENGRLLVGLTTPKAEQAPAGDA
jgi:hypothetical protein